MVGSERNVSRVQIHHIGLVVASLERSLGFYRDLLGLEEVFTWNPRAAYIGTLLGRPTVDLHSSFLRSPGSDVYLELLEYRNEPADEVPTATKAAVHIAFIVDDVDALYRELSLRAVESVSAPVTPTIGPNEGGRTVYMLDPDGYGVQLTQSGRSFAAYGPDGVLTGPRG